MKVISGVCLPTLDNVSAPKTANTPKINAKTCKEKGNLGNNMAKPAPNATPAETPKIYGSTKGFLS